MRVSFNDANLNLSLIRENLMGGRQQKRTYAGGECTWNKKRTEKVWYYSRYKDGKKVNISWFYIDGEKKYSKQKLRKMLAKSYLEFQVR